MRILLRGGPADGRWYNVNEGASVFCVPTKKPSTWEKDKFGQPWPIPSPFTYHEYWIDYRLNLGIYKGTNP